MSARRGVGIAESARIGIDAGIQRPRDRRGQLAAAQNKIRNDLRAGGGAGIAKALLRKRGGNAVMVNGKRNAVFAQKQHRP